jgi:tetratricopeptide (TPR) repeat protein
MVLLHCLPRAVRAESPTYLEAREKYERKEYLPAMLAAQKAVQEDDGNAESQHLYGIVLTTLKQFTDAVSHLRKAVALAPENAEFHYSLAATLLQEQREIAERLASQGLRKGRVRTGTEEEALQALRRTIELNPDHLKARLHLGRTYYDLNRSDLAEEQFRTVVKRNPYYQWGHYHLAVIALGRGSVEEALREYRKETELYPNESQAHLELAELLLKQGQTQSALEHLTAARTADPSQPAVHFALAKAFKEAGQMHKAIEAAHKSIELDPRSPDVYYLLGQLYRAAGETDAARKQMLAFERLKRELDQPEREYHEKLLKDGK